MVDQGLWLITSLRLSHVGRGGYWLPACSTIVSSTTRTLYNFTANYRFMSAYRFQQGTASRLYLFILRQITHHCERTLGCCATYGYTYTPAAYQQAGRLFCKQASTLEQQLQQILSKLFPLHYAYRATLSTSFE
jgi:hypothetical protein